MIQVFSIIAPLIAAAMMLLGPPPRRVRLWLVPLAALPALTLALFGRADESVRIKWLLLEAHLGLAHSGPAFLFFTAALWAIAGWYAIYYMQGSRPHLFKRGWERRRRFCVFWLMTLSGNIGLVLAGDVPSFYACFALMSFSAYGLVVSTGEPQALRAGRVYIVLALAGEAMLIGAFLLAVAAADSFLLADAAAAAATAPNRDLILLLALGGFGVKAGILPLHFWLPLAHPVAPAPASAVLSGAMIKAGLLGWIHLMPGGHVALPGWSVAIIALGMITAFYGVACGLGQRDLKTILAYSSVSQMGILLLVVGAGLGMEAAWMPATVVLAVYALNHAFSKGALFLGTDVCANATGASAATRGFVLAGLAFPALAIAGAPLMGGAVAKEAVKIATEVPAETVPVLRYLLPLSAVATTLLLGRFLILAWRKMARNFDSTHQGAKGHWWPWIACLGASVFGVYFAVPWYALELRTSEPSWFGIWESLWPILAGAALLILARLLPRRIKLAARIPPGDVIEPIEALLKKGKPAHSLLIAAGRLRINFHPALESWMQGRRLQRLVGRGEPFLRRKESATLSIMIVILALWWLLR